MFLAPQHFQQWDRHLSMLLDERSKALQALCWGFTEIKIDEDALVGGELVVQECRGVFLDGTSFRVPDVDPAPGNRRIADAFAPGSAELVVKLAVPKSRPGAMIASDDRADAIARYRRQVLTVVDENTGALERDIATSRTNLRVLFEGEPEDDYHTLPLACLERSPAGTFQLSSKFVPTCLWLSASPVLVNGLRRIYETLAAKSDELSKKRGQRLPGQAQFSVTEATGFWLLHTVNSYLPAVMHFYHQPRAHPEAAYQCLVRLAAELLTFSLEHRNPKDLPLYDHVDPGPVFRSLEDEIAGLPVKLVTDRTVPIAVERQSVDVFTGRVHDEGLLDDADFYIAVSAEVTADEIIRELPFQAKVSSPGLIAEIRNLAVRGAGLTHMASPPTDILARSGYQYFQLGQAGEHWDAIREARTLAFFIPKKFTDVQLECMAVKRDKSS